MGLTTRPSKNIDLNKIDDIQDEFFGEKTGDEIESKKDNSEGKFSPESSLPSKRDDAVESSGNAAREMDESEKTVKNNKKPADNPTSSRELAEAIEKPADSGQSRQTFDEENEPAKGKNGISENLKIADLLAAARFEGVRHTSRPYSVPRSLTIDLNRLKSKFRSRDLQYTQNELMDKMLKESLELVTADNYYNLREKAFAFVKSPEQSSRRSVTLTEETVSGMAELKADLAHAHNRRFSADEIFTTLLAVAFAPLYENGLL